MPRFPVALWIGMAGGLGAAPLEIARTPVLSATLPLATTWQVEQLQGSTWTGTGVLVPGIGAPVSVRMDTWPAAASYRFQQVAGAAATLTPVTGSGWHLAGQSPGVAQLQLQKSADLAAWDQEALVFPGSDGSFVRALREPLALQEFFRPQLSTTPVSYARVTGFTPPANNEGTSGFGEIYDDMPAIFRDGYVAALAASEFNRGGKNAASSGECYELAGPYGRTTVMVSDLAPGAPTLPGEPAPTYLDVGSVPFPILRGSSSGTLTVGARLVPAPVTGPVKLYVRPGASIYYTELKIYNHRAGVDKVEMKVNGATTWVELTRSTSNAFVYSPGGVGYPIISFPVQVRVTSRFGEAVTFTTSTLNSGQRISGPAQFEVFPELAPSPEPRILPVYTDLFPTSLGDSRSSSTTGTASVAEVDTSTFYQGTASARISGLGNFSIVNMNILPDIPRPEHGVLKLAIRAASPVAADQVALNLFGLGGVSSTAVQSPLIQLPPLSTAWQALEIPLAASGVPEKIQGISLQGRTSGALPDIWVDEVRFETR